MKATLCVWLLLASAAAASTRLRQTTEAEPEVKSPKPLVEGDTSGLTDYSSDGDGEVFNGSPASSGEFPAFAKLQYNVPGTIITCGGVLITPRHVLTAAHCYVKADGSEVNLVGVRIGATTSTTDGTYYSVTSRVRHPNYISKNSPFETRNDVAVLTLGSEVTGVTPLSFNRDSTYSAIQGTALTAIGFGKFGSGSSTSSFLRKTTVYTQTDTACDGATGAVYVNNEHMCTYARNTGTCGGDSGGPVMDSNKLVLGVLSFGLVDCTADSADFYTDLWNYASWIDQQTSGGSSTPSPTPSPASCNGFIDITKEAAGFLEGAAAGLLERTAARFGFHINKEDGSD